MYEPPPPPVETLGTLVAKRRRRPGLLAGLLVFVLLLVIGAGIGWMYEQQRRQLQHAATATAEMQQRAASAARQQAAQLEQLSARLKAQETALATLAEAQQGDRRRLQLMLVEELLLTANERLQLARDIGGAQLALELADARLAIINEPRLFKLREAIAGERGALGRVPRVDVGSAALSLSALVDAASALPLAARVPDRFEASAPLPAATTAPAAPQPNWFAGAWAQVKEALNAMFSVRRARGPAPRLLAPEQEAQVYQILLLRLEAVRAALLLGKQPALRQTATSAVRWLQQYFHSEDANVTAAIKELERIGALPLDAPLPDLSASVTLLRAELGESR